MTRRPWLQIRFTLFQAISANQMILMGMAIASAGAPPPMRVILLLRGRGASAGHARRRSASPHFHFGVMAQVSFIIDARRLEKEPPGACFIVRS